MYKIIGGEGVQSKQIRKKDETKQRNKSKEKERKRDRRKKELAENVRELCVCVGLCVRERNKVAMIEK